MYFWVINEQQHAMNTIATAHGYEVRTNGRTYFVTDSARQCRLATTSKVKAMNCLKKCLSNEGKTI